jgi:hypothetical protein
LGLSIQLGGLLLAMESFDSLCVVDEDSVLKDEPTEFRTKEAVINHIRRVLAEDFKCLGVLQEKGIVDKEGNFVLPPK